MNRVLGFFGKNKDFIVKRIEIIQQGDENEREALISEYIPFIIKTISKVTNRYVEIENHDEYSIGLQAFNEAIDKYEAQKGNFIKFAELIIRSRMIDYQRKETVPYHLVSTDQQEDDSSCLQIVDKQDFTERYDIQEQITRLEELLKEMGILFSDLVDESPKHRDTRLNCIRVARAIVQNDELKLPIYQKKMLPLSAIVKRENVSQKFLKGNRKFIIATVLILDSQLDLLKDYISDIERGQSDVI